MALIRAPLKFNGGGKGRVSRQTKYGANKGKRPAGRISVITGNRRG